MISAVILAAGQASRMGYTQKALQHYQGQALLDHVLKTIRPYVDDILLNVQASHVNDYSHYPYLTVSDESNEFLGPLAGVYAGLKHCRHEWLLVVPCDTPYLPEQLVTKLNTTRKQHTQCVVAVSPSGRQSVCMLVHQSTQSSLKDFLAQGQRKVEHWQQQLNTELCYFDDDAAFTNINTLHELKE